ncbi:MULTISPECIES: hypothetical protein [Nitrospirillum]|uniref:Uncharacterized protein n=1 Tax=Nitrospirillum amazonense TaxID=28077 RepID=A0A560F9R6_9PROT|nr:hypothetical protein [Nitrospirillum amazonense]TWB18362.1 hypothetical protein FBZ89_1107 [Nitrospirillum amazonense]TWB25711.1 hypothetical protein FBZ88_109108 [Nitrospirillum amazonense]TWB66117.1 hypothetical protein FBZ87_11681 [Nitrospirillum amazonense]
MSFLKYTALAIAVAAAPLSHAAFAQSAAPAAAAHAAPAHYSTAETEIGKLLDDPAAKALLDKYIPGMTSNDQIDMARAMTLKDIQQYSPDQVNDKVLAQLDAEFAKIPAK